MISDLEAAERAGEVQVSFGEGDDWFTGPGA